ncbi:hypothetical protein [Mesorhizobium sp. M0816]|uniref:hypothetical protein n=1 Tax=Mesorhizobium sp. M0816 TaxID=2957006 RepID=UPI00333D4CD7
MTHAISPVLRLLKKRISKVHCFGSGRLPEERQRRYGNPFPVETAIFRLEDSDVDAEAILGDHRVVQARDGVVAIFI